MATVEVQTGHCLDVAGNDAACRNGGRWWWSEEKEITRTQCPV